MAYQALTALMLISAPSDVPDEDMATIKKTVSQWNHAVGRASQKVVLPMSWSEHAVAEFGDRPQAILNEQLVEIADMALALFADRLGTPTGEADSGTLEEIKQMVDAGKHVSVLVNVSPRSLSGEKAVAEKQRLERALTELRSQAIVLTYRSQEGLVGHVNNMLSMAAGKIEGIASTAPSQVSEEARGVWPRIERETYQETDNQGRLKSRVRHLLLIRNETGRPVVDVSVHVDESLMANVSADDVIERMAPEQEIRFGVPGVWGRDATRGRCTVVWRYPDGEPQESTASLVL